MSRSDWEHYASMYGMYLFSRRDLYRQLGEMIREQVKGLHVLEIGCGNGVLTRTYGEVCASVTAIDYTARMITEAQKKETPDHIRFKVEDGRALNYGERSFDAVVIVNGLDQFMEPDKILQETARVLKDDGIVILATYIGEDRKRGGIYRDARLFGREIVYHHWSARELISYLEEQGWVMISQETLMTSEPFLYCTMRRRETINRADDSVISTASEELWMPLVSRINVSKEFPNILHDRPALEIEDKLPEIAKHLPEVSEYYRMSYAVLSAKTERIINMCRSMYEDLLTVNIKASLETFSLRCGGRTDIFYEQDDPETLSIREAFFPSSWYDRFLPYDLLDQRWMEEVKKEKKCTVLINACGALKDYSRNDVISFLKIAASYGEVMVLFDVDSPANGGILVQKNSLRDTVMPKFTLGSIEDLTSKLHMKTEVLLTENLFEGVNRRHMSVDTRLRIDLMQRLGLRKIYLLKIYGN